MGSAGVTFGVRRFAAEVHYRFINRYHDWRLGIETHGMLMPAELGIDRADSVEYTPIGYTAIRRALRPVPISVSEISFLDLGSGKGRVIAVAATKPYKKVLGVEISAELNGIARANIGRMRRRRAKHVEIIQSDAADFVIPDDINVIFLFNPFFGKTLARVVDNIRASYNARPRPIYILFFNKIHFERFIQDAGYGWIKPIHQLHCYPNYSCGIYKTASDAGIAEIRPQGAYPE
jgi:SAM-dependent methyltransferase